MSCYHKSFTNCVKSSEPAPPGHECCSQNTPSGKPKLGLWVKQGTCNKKTGLCVSESTKDGRIFLENFTADTIEGYDTDNRAHCSYQRPFWALFILFIIAIVSVTFFGIKKCKT